MTTERQIRVTKPADPFAAEIAATLARKRQREAMRQILAEQAKLRVLRPAPRYAPPMGLRERVEARWEWA